MRFVSWNCNGALRKKTEQLDMLNADVLIVQECEDPQRSAVEYKNWASSYLWCGQSKNKGIGIFLKGDLQLNPLDWNGSYKLDLAHPSPSASWSTKDLKLFLPCQINDYTIIAVWTKGGNNEVFSYIGQVWKFLRIHKKDLINKSVLMLGDFNSNVIWDKLDRWWNHSDVIGELQEIGIKSLYHHQTQEKQGEETSHTFFHQRNELKPYHIDYAFCSDRLLKKSTLQIGDQKDWLHLSDHLPLIIDIEKK